MKRATFRTLLAVLGGIFVGLGIYFLYALRFRTYLGDEPSACVNCHIMAPYNATRMHSSHGRDTICYDCHEQLDNKFVKTGRIGYMMARTGDGKACRDFGVASWGASFHAPREVARILAGELDRALQARLEISKVLSKHGFLATVAPAWLEAAKAAGKVVSL